MPEFCPTAMPTGGAPPGHIHRGDRQGPEIVGHGDVQVDRSRSQVHRRSEREGDRTVDSEGNETRRFSAGIAAGVERLQRGDGVVHVAADRAEKCGSNPGRPASRR